MHGNALQRSPNAFVLAPIVFFYVLKFSSVCWRLSVSLASLHLVSTWEEV